MRSTGVSDILAVAEPLIFVCALACAFRRLLFSILSRAYEAAEVLPSRRVVPLSGSVVDELLVMVGSLVLAESNLRASTPFEFFASDASSSRPGACRARVRQLLWGELFALTEEKGDYVRPDWGLSAPPTLLAHHRSAAGALAPQLNWTVMFSCAFVVMRLCRENWRDARILLGLGSRVAGAALERAGAQVGC